MFADLLLRFPVTLELTLLALLIGVPLGVTAALHPRKLADVPSSGLVLVGLAAPEFWLALLLILLFSLRLPLFPSSESAPSAVHHRGRPSTPSPQ